MESEDNLYVNACPGSGKTRVLTRKIAYQAIKHDGSLKRIIAITYTNRAAEEIKERLSLLSIDDDINIWVVEWQQFLTNFIRCRTSFRMLFRLSLTMSLLGCDDLRQELTVKVRLPR